MHGLWDFGMMICYAVPTLKKNIKAVQTGVPNYGIPRNDFFEHNKASPEEILELTKTYKQRLTSYLWLSSFSFFEAYVSSALQEVIIFHGGTESFIDSTERHARKAVAKTHSREVINSRARLSGAFEPHKVQRYQKHTRILQERGYVFPSELLAAYGVRMLIAKAKELKAVEIPALLLEGLHFEFTEETLARYDSYRKIRNQIAHGEVPEHSLKEAFEVRKSLGKLASKIDDHIIANFFVMEIYRSPGDLQ